MKTERIVLMLLVGLIAATAANGRGAEPSVDLGGITETHVMVPMRDGVRLSTYLYTPSGKGPWPVLYEQRYADLKGAETRKSMARLASAGYVVAAQNFRGAGLSEGVWVGYRALGWGETQDGYDSVEWLAKQPWSTGKIGTFGSSQAGFAQNFLAVAAPPHLTCQYMIDTGLSLFHEGYRIGGATKPERFKTMDPVCRNPADNRRLMQDWFAHPTYDDYWAQEDCTRFFDKMDVPCFTIGSWFDYMCVGSVASYVGREHRGGPHSKGTQQLLIGPWLHGRFKDTNTTGDLTFPENARFPTDAHMIRWFDHYLKGTDNGVERDSKVRYYTMGAVGEPGAPGNEWRTADDWPITVEPESLYLHPEGKLDGRSPVEASSTTTFLADPIHPNEIPGRAFPGAKDARDFETQPEVRTFTTEPLAEPVEWTGNVKAEIFLSSTAKDTDVIVRVSDVYPDGRSILLMDYIRRVRYRDGYDREVFLEPGQVARVAFDVGWTSQVFNRGHRIRITLASTGAPFYEPNPNTGEPLTIDPPARTVVATNAVHHEKAHPSRIIAPVRPKSDPGEARKRLGQSLQELQEWADARHNAIGITRETLADAEVFVKGIDWALRFEPTLTPADIGQIEKAAELARERLSAIDHGQSPWARKTGQVVRGFISKVDDSVQPYGVIVPRGYDGTRPSRLDVVLHGSSKPSGMSELRFMSRFDEGKDAPEADFIEIHPLGRVENGYRWAGETDVFEAIEAACRSYNIDRDRIVLRGMSMGASGTWHLGLKHPDRFVALGPYCGYVDTHRFSETPLPNFVKVGPLPSDQEKGLHMLDSVDYAANAGVVPAIACIGDQDIFFRAHVIMGRAMAAEGLTMVNLISHGTGHVIDPATHREQMRRIGSIAEKGLDHAPRHIRFVTWTLKYSECHWLQVLGLDAHYDRAEIDARVADDGTIVVAEPKNITRFSLLPPAAIGAKRAVTVGGKAVSIGPAREGRASPRIVLETRDGAWVEAGEASSAGKRPGIQGPIDDAFTAPFLCVRGTGTPWNPAVQAWADASLDRFAREWDRYFRGKLLVRDDSEVTEDDAHRYNLILFGDPGSNSWIRRVLPDLPVRWTRERCEVGGKEYSAADHAWQLIQPNPAAPEHYVVLNSGHTFREAELSTLNYLLFPKIGDWAVVKVDATSSGSSKEDVVRTGYFDEGWRLRTAEAR